ncbi:Rho-binding antiterminator [Pseudomonas sp. GV071]|jgi:Rho-binding antiterminator|uniref:Rho-binding antiterminator n=1 Tax=Pseudomonas sp. GV071 TaxID=2135754 RepID=UPI000D3639BA|nr:Rho-binding antiterminator [Pseudomonas sp. GV071]PTQ69204.1 Rof transcriptional antiterminator [Pseudomonas sp. GV071]
MTTPDIPYQPLDCDLYDYLEMACLYQYRVLVEMVEGGRFEAVALDTHTNARKEEFLVVQVDDEKVELRIDRLLAITPLNEKAKFGRVELAGLYCAK